MTANVFIRRYFLKSSLSVKHAPLLSLFLIRRRIHFLCSLLSLICFWLSDKLPPAIINNRVSLLLLCASFLKKAAFLHKPFEKYFLIVIVLYILRISLCVTNA